MATTINMPSLGESVSEGEVGKWLVKEGDRVEKDQALLEIMTDKADSEIPATVGGVVTRILVAEGDVISVGAALCEIDPSASASEAASVPAPSTPVPVSAPVSPAPPREQVRGAPPAAEAITSPTVRKRARELGIDLAAVQGSGDGGRITREDVERASALGKPGAAAPSAPEPLPPAPLPAPVAEPGATLPRLEGPRGAFKLPPYRPVPGDEIVPFTRRRRIIADHMVFSKLTAPHVVTFAECDLDRTARLRDAHKGELRKLGINLTYLAFVAAATVRALQEFPELNARVLDDAYVRLREINLGIAVDTEAGLVVPVIPNADELSIRGIARAIEELAAKARDGELVPDDLAGKTFAISNPGRRGNLVGGAIISQPNVGILRIGEIKKRVVVIEQGDADVIMIHPVMYMALSYDHRVVDGVNANGFLWRVNQLLEEADFEV